MTPKNFSNETIRSVTTHHWVDRTPDGTTFTISVTVRTTNGRLHTYDSVCPTPIEQWGSESQVHGNIVNTYQHAPTHTNTPIDQCTTPLPTPQILAPVEGSMIKPWGYPVEK